MPFYDYQCPSCGGIKESLQKVGVQEIPCPNVDCACMMSKVWLPVKRHIITDDIPGGVWLENYGPNPVKVYSHTERRALMNQPRVDSDGNTYFLTEMVRHVGEAGTDKSKHTTDWSKGSIDPYTLEAARILVERVSKQSPPTHVDEDSADYNDPSFVDPSVRPFNAATEAGQPVPATIREIVRRRG